MIPKLSDVQVIARDEQAIFSWPADSDILSIQTVPSADGREFGIDYPHTMAGRWPVLPYPFDETGETKIEATLWCILQHEGVWKAFTCHWVRPGQTHKEFSRDEWPTYDLGLPQGSVIVPWNTLVGFFVSTPARLSFRGPVKSRSHIVWTLLGTSQIVAREEVNPVSPEPIPLNVLAEIAAKYGVTADDESVAGKAARGKFLNHVAYLYRDSGWGLSAKPSGNNVPGPHGVQIAGDILHHKPSNVLVDVVNGSNGSVMWSEVGPATDPNRPWVAPVAPDAEVIPPPTTDLTAVLARLDAIQTSITNLKVQMAGVIAQAVAGLPQALKDEVSAAMGAALGQMLPVLGTLIDSTLKKQEWQGTARIFGQNINFTLKPKV